MTCWVLLLSDGRAARTKIVSVQHASPVCCLECVKPATVDGNGRGHPSAGKSNIWPLLQLF